MSQLVERKFRELQERRNVIVREQRRINYIVNESSEFLNNLYKNHTEDVAAINMKLKELHGIDVRTVDQKTDFRCHWLNTSEFITELYGSTWVHVRHDYGRRLVEIMRRARVNSKGEKEETTGRFTLEQNPCEEICLQSEDGHQFLSSDEVREYLMEPLIQRLMYQAI